MSIHALPDSERMEAASLEALHASASDEVRERLGLHLERIDGTTVSIAANDPTPLFNRAVGLGLSEPATEDTIEYIRAAYRDRGIERFYLGVHPDSRPGDLDQLLENAGLKRDRGWMKFERGPEPAPVAESDLRVRKIDAEDGDAEDVDAEDGDAEDGDAEDVDAEGIDAEDTDENDVDAFGRIAAAAYGMSPDAAGLVRGLADRPEYHLYMTFDDHTPAGTGAMIVDGDRAWFEWAATDPEFRKRGSQRAVLARRIEAAVDAGCTRLLTCTGEAVPGDAQHSYHNIEWAGFEPTFVRENWVPE